MTLAATPCPACSNHGFEELIDFGQAPQTGAFLAHSTDSIRTIHLAFEYCPHCALLRRKSFGDESHDYTDVSRATGRQLPTYGSSLAESFRADGIGAQDLIVEVGANDGAFLDALRAAGFSNLVGIEPSKACSSASIAKGYRIEMTHLDEAAAAELRERYGPARAVVCRHTLEHVPDPRALLVAMRALLDDGGLLFIEVPNAQAIIHEFAGHELWDEHLHITTPENLQMLVRSAGFEVTRCNVWTDRNRNNILLWARTGAPATPHSSIPAACSADAAICAGFERRWNRYCEAFCEELSHCSRPVAAIGASHPQTNYFLFTRSGGYVDYLIDDDSYKLGRFAPIPNPVAILSSEQFHRGEPPATVICSAFGYDVWMDRLLAPLVNRGVRLVRPYSPRLLASAFA
jgi:hypothetical protein